MAPQRFIELRPIGKRKLTTVSEYNPLGALPLKDIKHPDQLEGELQQQGISTLRIKPEDCCTSGGVLVAYHEESLRGLIKGPFNSAFAKQIQNNGTEYFIKALAKYPGQLDAWAGLFSNYRSKTPNELLAFLKNIGPRKAIGELSVSLIQSTLGENGLQQMTEELEARGIKTILRRSAVAHISNKGALFGYDETALEKLLNKPENRALLIEKHWPTTPEGFVRAISSDREVRPGSALWRLIGEAFADPGNANLHL